MKCSLALNMLTPLQMWSHIMREEKQFHYQDSRVMMGCAGGNGNQLYKPTHFFF